MDLETAKTWIEIISLGIGVPVAIITLWHLVRKDKEKTEMIQELRRQSEAHFQHNIILESHFKYSKKPIILLKSSNEIEQNPDDGSYHQTFIFMNGGENAKNLQFEISESNGVDVNFLGFSFSDQTQNIANFHKGCTFMMQVTFNKTNSFAPDTFIIFTFFDIMDNKYSQKCRYNPKWNSIPVLEPPIELME